MIKQKKIPDTSFSNEALELMKSLKFKKDLIIPVHDYDEYKIKDAILALYHKNEKTIHILKSIFIVVFQKWDDDDDDEI